MENSKFITSWQEVHTIVDDAMAKGDRSVTIYISPDGGMSIAVSLGRTRKRFGQLTSRAKSHTMTIVQNSAYRLFATKEEDIDGL